MRKIKLTENQLHYIIKESVNKIIKEGFYDIPLPSDTDDYDNDDDDNFETHEKIKASDMGVNQNDDVVQLVSQSCGISIEDAYDNVVSYLRNEAELSLEGDFRRKDLYDDAMDLGIESDSWIPYAMEHMDNY